MFMIGLKTNKKGYGKQCKKKYFNNIYWITLCIVYDLLQNVMNNIKGKYASRKTLTIINQKIYSTNYKKPKGRVSKKTYTTKHLN